MEKELRNELEETIKDIRDLASLVQFDMREIDKLGRNLLEELKKIKGWETMILDWNKDISLKDCTIDYDIRKPSIYFIDRTDPDEPRTILEIDLEKELVEQVKAWKRK